MWYIILKKDLMKRKGINLILLLFMMLSTIFLASSVSNIYLVLRGVDHYMEVANVCDVQVALASDSEHDVIEEWIKSRSEITEYDYEELYGIKAEDVVIKKDGKQNENEEKLFAEGWDIYIGTEDGKYAKPLDADGNALSLDAGTVALSSGLADKNGLRPGDTLGISFGDRTFDFEIALICKDILWGNEMSGMTRLVFNRNDFERITADGSGVKTGVFGFCSTDASKSTASMNEQHFQTLMSTVLRSTYTMLYVFDMIIAALLIAIGICLILISLMILRFSLMFTMEENYREIGVMKAIGMRDFSIRKIYFIKYLALVTAGALAGFLISIPVGDALLKVVSKNMVLGNTSNIWGLNLFCSMAVVVFVTGMCILFTGKLKKVSAIDAIRNGEKGERYQKRRGLDLHTKKHMGTVAFLGLNDILCNKKRYLVLFFTFCISFVLITVPLNTLTTMESDEMTEKFSLNPDAAYIEKIEAAGDEPYHSIPEIERALERIRKELSEKGYDAEVGVLALFFTEWTTLEGRNIGLFLTRYRVGAQGSECMYAEGVVPRLENEVAFSKTVMEENGLAVGDTILTKIDGKDKEFLITGCYSDYMQLGRSACLSPALDMDSTIASGYWKTEVVIDTELSAEEQVEKFEKEFPQYKWTTAQQAVDVNIGSVKNTLEAMQMPMTAMLCILIMLITILMMKLFLVREKGQIAMLKSIGYRSRYIRMWFMMRMVWVVILSMAAAVPLSILSNQFILTPVFGIMGAELDIQVNVVKAYLVYPGVLLAGIMAAVVIATTGMKKINTSDMKIAE